MYFRPNLNILYRKDIHLPGGTCLPVFSICVIIQSMQPLREGARQRRRMDAAKPLDLNSQISNLSQGFPICTIGHIIKRRFSSQKSTFFIATCGILHRDIVIDRNWPLLLGRLFSWVRDHCRDHLWAPAFRGRGGMLPSCRPGGFPGFYPSPCRICGIGPPATRSSR